MTIFCFVFFFFCFCFFFFLFVKTKMSICRYSVIFYILPMMLLMVQKRRMDLQIAFLCLSYYGFRNHCRKYNSEIRYDFIDIIDRLCIIYICSHFIYEYYHDIIVWIALLYMIFIYFLVIPRVSLFSKIWFHCSFHLVTLCSSLNLLSSCRL